jgi:hypothetical protein
MEKITYIVLVIMYLIGLCIYLDYLDNFEDMFNIYPIDTTPICTTKRYI